MKKIISCLLIILLLCYPFAIYYGTLHFSPRYLALGLLALLLLRFAFKRKMALSTDLPLLLTGVIGVATSMVGMISNQLILLKLYPFFINLTLLLFFSYSLLYPPTVVERIARLTETDLQPEAINYMRKVTLVWCLFFCMNGTIALWTSLQASTKWWALYNGFIAYILMGILFLIELLIRYFVKRRLRHA